MGKIKYLPKIENFVEKNPCFRSRDIELIVKNKSYTHLLLHNLSKRKKIFRLTKGCYSKKDDPVLSVFCFEPAYLGLQEALSFYNLWEQETVPVILTIRKIREGKREVLETNVILKRIPPQYFFGFELKKYNDTFLPVADFEKTLIDFFYFKEPISKEVIKNLKRKINLQKLKNYLKKYPKKISKEINQVLNLNLN